MALATADVLAARPFHLELGGDLFSALIDGVAATTICECEGICHLRAIVRRDLTGKPIGIVSKKLYLHQSKAALALQVDQQRHAVADVVVFAGTRGVITSVRKPGREYQREKKRGAKSHWASPPYGMSAVFHVRHSRNDLSS